VFDNLCHNCAVTFHICFSFVKNIAARKEGRYRKLNAACFIGMAQTWTIQ